MEFDKFLFIHQIINGDLHFIRMVEAKLAAGCIEVCKAINPKGEFVALDRDSGVNTVNKRKNK